MEVLINLFTPEIKSHLALKLIVVIVCWLLLAFAMMLDYRSAIKSAKRHGKIITSGKMQMSVAKVNKYYNTMLFALILDVLISSVWIFWQNGFLEIPITTIIATGVMCFIEWKSVQENRKDGFAKQLRKEGGELFDLLLQNKDKLQDLIDLKRQMDDAGENGKNTKYF